MANLAGDYYHYEESTYELVGETTGKRYKLGQTIEVAVASVNKVLRTIDFMLPKDMEDFFGMPEEVKKGIVNGERKR